MINPSPFKNSKTLKPFWITSLKTSPILNYLQQVSPIHLASTPITESAVKIFTPPRISWKSYTDYNNSESLNKHLEKCPSQKLSSLTVNLLKTLSFSEDYAKKQACKNPFQLFHSFKLILATDSWEILLPKTYKKSCLLEVIPSKGTLISVLCWWNSKYNLKSLRIKTNEKSFSLRAQVQLSTEMETCSVQEWARSSKAFNTREPSKVSKDKSLWQTKITISGHWKNWPEVKDVQLKMQRR